jgi:uncharacterized phage-associated protein
MAKNKGIGMIHFKFDEKKAVQSAVLLLNKNGGKMNYMKLIKLLYLAEREALDRFQRPIIGDSYCSLPKGPILSRVLDRINNEEEPGNISEWGQHIATKGYDVVVQQEAGEDELSEIEISILEEIYDKFKGFNQYQMVDFCHRTLTEWNDPNGSSLPIPVENILAALGRTDDDIKAINNEVRIINRASEVFA